MNVVVPVVSMNEDLFDIGTNEEVIENNSTVVSLAQP